MRAVRFMPPCRSYWIRVSAKCRILAARPIPPKPYAPVVGPLTILFISGGQDQKAKSDAALVARLYQEIGQLKVERDFLAERSGP